MPSPGLQHVTGSVTCLHLLEAFWVYHEYANLSPSDSGWLVKATSLGS